MIKLLLDLLKNKKFHGFLLRVVTPFLCGMILLQYNKLLGVAFFLLWLAYLLYMGRIGIYMLMGNIAYNKKTIDEALKWYEKAYSSGKAKVTQSTLYGYLLLKSGKAEEAEVVFNKILQEKATDDEKMLVKSNLALVYWKKGLLDDAVTLLEEIYSQYKTTSLYGSLGYLLILKGDMERALKLNLEAAEYNGSNSVILDNLGQTYYIMGELEKAEEIYKKLISGNPTFPEAYYNYGVLLLKTNRPEEGLSMLKKAYNYRLTYLSAITKEEIDAKVAEAEKIIN